MSIGSNDVVIGEVRFVITLNTRYPAGFAAISGGYREENASRSGIVPHPLSDSPYDCIDRVVALARKDFEQEIQRAAREAKDVLFNVAGPHVLAERSKNGRTVRILEFPWGGAVEIDRDVKADVMHVADDTWTVAWWENDKAMPEVNGSFTDLADQVMDTLTD